MVGSTYAPEKWIDVEASKVLPNVIGIAGTAAANTTTDFDTLIANDSIIRGIEFGAKACLFGDSVTIKVIDKDAVYAPANTVLALPVSAYTILADATFEAAYTAQVPKKILGGLYVRVSYTATSLLTAVNVGVNFLFIKVLV